MRAKSINEQFKDRLELDKLKHINTNYPEEYYQAKEVLSKPDEYHKLDVLTAKAYIRGCDDIVNMLGNRDNTPVPPVPKGDGGRTDDVPDWRDKGAGGW